MLVLLIHVSGITGAEYRKKCNSTIYDLLIYNTK
jgi:hypothetical protein